MKVNSRFKKTLQILFAIQFGIALITHISAQQRVPTELTSPIYGKVMLVGSGEISNRMLSTFAYLADEEDGALVILSKKNARKSELTMQWKNRFGKVTEIKVGNILSEEALNTLNEASAVWLSDDFSKDLAGSKLNDELKALLHRNGTIGGQGVAAESIATLVKEGGKIRDGFNLLPNSCISTSANDNDEFKATLHTLPGRVGWEIPAKAAVVIHSGRKISVIGDADITLRTAANGDWAERVQSYGPPIDDLPFSTDLVSWNRSAVARQGELFPPAVAPVPEVPNGALVIVGGHGFPEGMWQRVVDFAGGTDANFVCFSQSESSTGAEKLRARGCKNIAIYVTKTGVKGIGQADNPELLEDLKNADAVYFGGGRTYKFMDAYLNTEAHRLMNEVLERGGIILGGSAGAQIQGDFLVRGNPVTNNTIWMEGNDVGLGFLKGVIIDVHFRERGREDTLPSLLVKHPQMLGIGIDETTAIWVEGTTAEVLGPHSVTFYDLKNEKDIDSSSEKIGNPLVLMKGEKYNLKQRKAIDE